LGEFALLSFALGLPDFLLQVGLIGLLQVGLIGAFGQSFNLRAPPR